MVGKHSFFKRKSWSYTILKQVIICWRFIILFSNTKKLLKGVLKVFFVWKKNDKSSADYNLLWNSVWQVLSFQNCVYLPFSSKVHLNAFPFIENGKPCNVLRLCRCYSLLLTFPVSKLKRLRFRKIFGSTCMMRTFSLTLLWKIPNSFMAYNSTETVYSGFM